MDKSIEESGQDLWSEVEDLADLHLVDELVDNGLSESILHCGVLEPLDCPGVFWLNI